MTDNWFSASKKEGGARDVLACLGIGGAVATVLVFSILFFTEIRFTAEGVLSLSLHFALLFFSSFVMYFFLFEAGREKGEGRSEFLSAEKRAAALLARYEAEGDVTSLRRFCVTAEEKERRAERERLLAHCLMTEEESNALLLRREGMTLKERRIRFALRRVNAIRVTPALLLAQRKSERQASPLSLSPERLRLRRTLTFLLLTAVTAAFSVTVAFDVLLSPTAGTVAAYLLKLFTLFGSGVRGYKAGYLHVTDDVTAYRTAQSALLEEYLKELEKEKTALLPQEAP